MIIHPDGRLEGTPEELAAYQREMKSVFAPLAPQEPQPWTTWRPWMPWDTIITCGSVTYSGPDYEVRN